MLTIPYGMKLKKSICSTMEEICTLHKTKIRNYICDKAINDVVMKFSVWDGELLALDEALREKGATLADCLLPRRIISPYI